MGAFIAFIACVLIWGSTWYGIEFQLGVVAKEWSVVYRFALAAILLQAWCRMRGLKADFGKKGHILAAGTGVFLFGLNYLLMYSGTEYLTSGLVAVAFSMLSLMNIISARIFLKIPVQLPILGAAVLGIIGLTLVFSHEIAEFNFADGTVVGLAFCISGTVIASFGNTIAASEPAKAFPILPFTALGLSYSMLFNLAVALASGEPVAFDARAPYVISLLYLTIVGTIIAFTVYLWLISQIGVARAGYISVVMPLVALTISTIFEGFEWSAAALAGLSLIIVGNALMVRLKDKGKMQPAPAE